MPGFPFSSPADQRPWRLPAPLPGLGAETAEGSLPDLPTELLAVLGRRGLADAAAVRALLDPPPAPAATDHFPDLTRAVRRLSLACNRAEALAICGDYDADGMTSTALLVGVLGRLGAAPKPAIPSRQEDGYGLNAAMVEALAAEGIGLLITVDNGVAARDALERAQALGVEVILTDHHTLPAELPPHLALLHPAVTPDGSPYRGLAGVGLAFVLASALCRSLARADGEAMARDLFCIGTIADMAPLQGVNRRWLLDGLPRLGESRLQGLRALLRIAGVEDNRIDAGTVGFQIAPRLNAVGRLGDPLLVVELLTTDDADQALELARRCDALNRQRRDLCAAIEAEALALLEADGDQRASFLLLAQNHWHHGVIGIVAARLMERFDRPVALLASEGGGRLRASVRAPRGFAVDQALNDCADLLERHGGHPAAGGFTVRAERVGELHSRLDQLAMAWLEGNGGRFPIEPEAQLRLERIDRPFWQQLQRLEPFGIGHPAPLFWSSGCRVLEQRRLRGGHLHLELEQQGARRRAIGWRWPDQDPVPELVDLAYRLRLDRWQGEERLQLELVALRPGLVDGVVVRHRQRHYHCRREGQELLIRNDAGIELRASVEDDVSQHPYLRRLVQVAALALGLTA
ncbi:MAG: single-stranded-DNA-specific exonuclease RecJ [Cyanobium sp.]